MKSYMPAVVKILKDIKANSILDAPCGDGWLKTMMNNEANFDGVDLFASTAKGYNKLIKYDLDKGLPKELGKYDAIVSCEGLEHFGNPLLFLEDCKSHLKENGTLIITTPNIWYPASKLKYLTRGFFPSFPSIGEKVKRGTHMHITPWCFPWLYLYFRLAGFDKIKLFDLDEPKPKHLYERIIGLPQKLYCKQKLKNSETFEEKNYWIQTGSDQSLYGRRLVVTGVRVS
jgi:SAM-dependent methyltransferase